MKQVSHGRNIFTRPLLFVFLGLCTTTMVLANPSLHNIDSGTVNLQPLPNRLIVNQTSDKAIINWNSFNIGQQESVHFNQPVNGIALNRISPQQGASQIYGVLSATGRVILINPAGIYFGPTASVNVGGLIATTSDISNDNFNKGIYQFDQASPFGHASIINEGTIKAAQYGMVALVGQNVTNNGVIQATTGRVSLAAGDVFTVDFNGDHLINFAASKTSRPGSVTNNGTLMAEGGRIMVTAQQASGLLDNVINMNGIVQAQSISEHAGEIIIGGDSKGGIVRIAGKLDASGKRPGEKGGGITITGYNILLDSTAELDVSGDTGGGTVYVGDHYRGTDFLPHANAVVMLPNARIEANAITQGNGGHVVLWSDHSTKAYGYIEARGGSEGGNGGLVETSSENYLDVNGINIDTSAAKGDRGTWLLDPTNIYIASSLLNAQQAGMQGADMSVDTSGPSLFVASGPAQDSLLLTTTLNNALNTNNVEVSTANAGSTAAGFIVVVNTIGPWANANTLTLTADTTITLKQGIAIGAGGSLFLNAVGDVFQESLAIISGSGDLIKNGAGTFFASQPNTYTGQTLINAGTINASDANALGTVAGGTTVASGASLVVNNVAIGAEALVLNGSGIGNTGALIGNGTASYGGTVTLSGANAVTMGVPAADNSLTINGTLNGTQDLILTGSGGAFIFNNNVTLPGITTTAGNYDVAFNAAVVSVTNAATFQNTGILSLGAGSSTLTFGGGLTATSPGNVILNGVLQSNGNAITLGTTTLAGTSTVATNNGVAAGANLTIGNITSNGNSLTLNAGTSGTLTTGSYSGGGSLSLNAHAINVTGALSGSFSVTGANPNGSNSLALNTGSNQTWTLSGIDSGSISASTTGSFSNIQNLTGGNANDTFVFTNNAVLNGLINGGGNLNSVTNTLDYSGYSVPVTVTLDTNQFNGTTMAGSLLVNTYSNINNLLGNPNNHSTLVLVTRSQALQTVILDPNTGTGIMGKSPSLTWDAFDAQSPFPFFSASMISAILQQPIVLNRKVDYQPFLPEGVAQNLDEIQRQLQALFDSYLENLKIKLNCN